ncbi:hypothetical protein [Seonamhaeicola marinus]|uniref:Uncharacterized protein n=1 Tax=Seonamhaeicola marinus TaxID=1912246 RepID=A0A5D0IZA5_9FLAO|nr:hypothetical protein [Seonamhaeicola marinus]TYA89255.1 hypothetical protein FUA24_03740 [Seonamhaeicola marinus]
MAGIKIQGSGSKEHITLINKNSTKFNTLCELLEFDNENIVFLEKQVDFNLKGDKIDIFKTAIENKIYSLLTSSEYIPKESGHAIILKEKSYYLNSKSFKLDREITTLNSILKIVLYCSEKDVPLLIEHQPDGIMETIINKWYRTPALRSL